MLFTIKKPKSQRFFRLLYKGFTPSGKNAVVRFFNAWIAFIGVIRRYLFQKIGLLLFKFFEMLFWLSDLPTRAKGFLVKKLIWSRGRLGRTIALWVILGTSFGVFFFGEIFSGSTLIIEQTVNADYLAAQTDIIPGRVIATTTIPDQRKMNEPFAYTIEPGDTLSAIGNKFKITADALKYVNGLTDASILKVGSVLTIPPVSGLIHKVESGDTLSSIADKFQVAPQAIADFNYILDTSKLAIGTELVIPGGKVPQQFYAVPDVGLPPSQGGQKAPAANKNFCVWPSTVRIITQYFTWYHNGLDIATPLAGGMPPLLSCREGRVIRAGWDPFGLGLHVRIDHGNGYETVYGHMSRLDVSYGQKVKAGQIIGLMGNTGRSTGPHVHYMVKYNGAAQNPLSYMN